MNIVTSTILSTDSPGRSRRRGVPGISRSVAAAVLGLVMLTVFGLNADRAAAQILDKQVPIKARGLEIVEHLGATLPMDLEFVNSKGDTVKLGSYFSPAIKSDGTPNGATGPQNGKPVVVVKDGRENS